MYSSLTFTGDTSADFDNSPPDSTDSLSKERGGSVLRPPSSFDRTRPSLLEDFSEIGWILFGTFKKMVRWTSSKISTIR